MACGGKEYRCSFSGWATAAIIMKFPEMKMGEKLSILILPLLFLLSYFLIFRNKSNVFEDGRKLIVVERGEKNIIPFCNS